MNTPKRIPDEAIERIINALKHKWSLFPTGDLNTKQINTIVSTTVCDVCLILEGSAQIDWYENGDEEIMGVVE